MRTKLMGILLFFAALFAACSKDASKEEVSLPKVETGVITAITTTSFTSSCNVLSDGNGVLTACGLVYGTAPSPTLQTAQSTNEISTGVRTEMNTIDGLERNKKYYVRAYATNSAGTAYGAVREFTLQTSVSGITLSASELNLFIGQNYTLAVIFTPANPYNPSLKYEIDNAEIATISDKGLITPLKRGRAKITVTAADGGHTAICDLTVRRPVEGISFAEAEINLVEGSTKQLVPTIMPEDAEAPQITYKSESPSIATVTESGLVTAVKAGVVKITATLAEGGKPAVCTITVTPKHIKVESLTLSPESLALAVDQTAKLTATITPLTATDKTITYVSQDPNIASVSADGTVLAKSIGRTTITATTKTEGKKATCIVEVKAKVVQVERITIDAPPSQFFVGEPWNIKYHISPSNASSKEVEITSDNPQVASVASLREQHFGLPTIWAKGAGTCTITVKALDGSNTQASVKVTVKAIPPALRNISIPTSLQLTVGETYTFEPKIEPAGAEADILWSSSREDIATIGNTTGKVVALAPGVTEIVAMVPVQHRQIRKACYLTVVAKNVEGSEHYKSLVADFQNAEKKLKDIEDLFNVVKTSGKSPAEQKTILKEALSMLEDNLQVVITDLLADVTTKRNSLVGDEFKKLSERGQQLSREYERVHKLVDDYYWSL